MSKVTVAAIQSSFTDDMAKDIARIGTLVDFFGLVPSGGSDWHGATDGPRVLGAMRVPGEWLDRQDARVAARRAAEQVA